MPTALQFNFAATLTGRELGNWTTIKAVVDDNQIAWVQLNRPEKRNCMSPTLNDEMLQVLDAVALDDQARVMVLTGAGEAFSAGMDLQEFFRDTDNLKPMEREIVQRSCFEWQGPRLRNFPLPTIAMVNGYCFGGAFLPMGNCDIAIAADEALFGLSEVNWGIIPGGNVPIAVVHNMSQRDAIYYSISGETFTGVQAADMKLVNESVPGERLYDRVVEVAKMMATKNPSIVRTTKEMIRNMRTMGYAEAENYINAKFDEALYNDGDNGRSKGLQQFLDEKSIRPGLEGYKS
jgi:feruloyl-CoA hydratase/lyase